MRQFSRLLSAVCNVSTALAGPPAHALGGRAAPSATRAPERTGAGCAALRRLLTLVVVTVGACLSLAAGVAQAKLVLYGSFGSGQLNIPIGVGVDQTSHDVYVAGVLGTPASVQKFDSSGTLISPPSPFGAGSGSYSGVAVNPTDGDVYVLDASQNAIETYDPSTGAELSSFSVPPSSNPFFGSSSLAQIASDAAGNVYVPIPSSNEVQEYNPVGTLLQTFTGSGANALSGPSGVAVDATGDVWVADAGNNRIEELDQTGALVTSFASTGVAAVAVDGSGDVFALVFNSAESCGTLSSPCYHVIQYSAAGAALADVGAGTIGAVGPASVLASTVAVDDATGKVYVTDTANNVVWVFAPPTAPAIGREVAEQITSSGATLGARINPGGADTRYQFEYGTTTAYGQITPVPDGDAGAGVQPGTVWATATGLASGTTYHYRVVATNSAGTVTGPDQTFTTVAGGCPNDQFRTGFSAGLPDCRAYEMVTPPNKDSGAPGELVLGPGHLPGFQVASNGNGVSYFSHDSFPGSLTGSASYLATRSASGWSSQNLIPPQSGEYGDRCAPRVGIQLYSADLSTGILADGQDQSPAILGGGGCGTDFPNLVPGEPQGFQNLFLRNNTNGAYQLVDVTPAGVTPSDADLAAGSADLSHVVFYEAAPLTSDAPANVGDVYEWTDGQVRLVTYIPTGGATKCGAGGSSCTPVAGSLAGGLEAETDHAVSADGSKIFFTAGGNLYVRDNGDQTLQIDASQAGGSGGGGAFAGASVDGSQVFFTDDASAGLTGNTAPGSGANLYSYDTDTGKLTDLAPRAGVDVGGVLGISDDGSYVYFTAGGVLAPGGTAGQPNIYVDHAGTITFVAAPSNLGVWPETGTNGISGARVSANGEFLVFTSTDSVTGYDTAGTCTPIISANHTSLGWASGGSCNELYLYASPSGELSCASCNPDGAPPIGGAALPAPQLDGQVDFGGSYPIAYAANSVSDSGQVFFDTPDALLPADTNGKEDVYEYEAGQLHLLSTGTSPDNSWFVNATPSGSDAFFVTSQQLLPQDGDTSPDLYDARVAGGFPAPPVPGTSCVGDACRPPGASASPPTLAASITFFGPGNAPNSATAAASGRVRILSRVMRGPSFALRLSVPMQGRVTVTGTGITTVRRSVATGETYGLTIRLTAKWRRALARDGKLRLRLRLRYEPTGGRASTARFVLTDER